MFTKLFLTFFSWFFAFVFGINMAAGQDTIPPNITVTGYADNFDNNQIKDNYPLGDSEVFDSPIKNDSLKIELSCVYTFPDEYYFYKENATIEDDSGILQDTIVVDSIVYDDLGYGTVYQTIIAEDNSGNVSKLVIIISFGYWGLYSFDFQGMNVGGVELAYDEESAELQSTYFEFCELDNVNVAAFVSKNGCTGHSKINWYIDDEQVSSDSEEISVDLSKQNNSFTVIAEAKFNNTGGEDRIPINIRKKVNDSQTEIQSPTCSNSADGIINLAPEVSNVKWLHNNSNALSLNSLEAGSYHVTYTYNDCDFNDTIILVPENIFDFTISDTIINQNEFLTITNTSNLAGDFLWQIGDSSFVKNTTQFDYAFTSPGNYKIKLTNLNGNCNDTIFKSIAVKDTTPPKITVNDAQITTNYFLDEQFGFDGTYSYSGEDKDTVEIILSCKYSFPEDYYFKLENALIEDDSNSFKDTIVVDEIIYDDLGYGTIVQTIVAEDSSGNTSEFVIISKVSENKHSFDVLGMNVGGIEVAFNENIGSLEITDFEFCEIENVEVVMLYSKNRCTGDTKIDWYIDDELVSTDSDGVSLDLSNNTGDIDLAAEAKYSNTNLQDRIRINIQKTVNDTQTEIQNPTCSNLADGVITLDSRVSNVEWQHNNSNALSLNSLKADFYYVSYTHNDCEFNDTITLVSENILDFTVSDTTIDLNQNEMLTIKNISNIIGDFLWQIGDSSFVNNTNEFDYTFKSPGDFEIKLMNNNGVCNNIITKNITVGPITTVYTNMLSSINIGPNPFTNVLNIGLKKSSDYKITVYGIDGKTYFKDHFYDIRNNELDLNFLNPGVYFVKISSPKNSELVKGYKIVKL